jgi:DNA-binding response OmpR family regulator
VPASQESRAGTASSVLLVEEYDALAAAISSALKKFAPRHRVRAVESLAEAEASMAEDRPQLVIVDFDPPRPDAVEFLEKIAAANPNGRFLAVASGVPPELNGERYGPNAIQFIEKPFELADFGAAVQALLGPWMNAISGDSRGTLRDLNVRDLLPLLCLNSATAVLHLRSEDDDAGEIHFLDGHITHAVAGNFTGPGALQRMMRWKSPRARESERVIEAPRTIHGPWAQAFVEALRKTAAAPEDRPPAPAVVAPKVAASPKKTAPAGKKIVIIDDTEMLLIFVEDTLCTADPTFQIVTALTGNEGVRRAETMLPDLVLLDYSLPDLRGDEVCERLSQNESTSRIPVIMMSGHVSEMAAAGEKYANIVGTIAKPFMGEALVALVTEILKKGPLPPTAPARQGNGKRPVKKNGASSPKEIGEKHPMPTPRPAAPAAVIVEAPPPPPPASPPVPTPGPHPEPPAIAAEEIVEKTAAAPPPAPIPQPAAFEPPAPVISAVLSYQAQPPLVAQFTQREPAPVVLPSVSTMPRPAEPLLSTPPAPLPVPPSSPALPSVAPRRLAASNGSSVVLGLGMEVLAVQFTPRFQIGTIRARPTASTLSLTHSSAPAENLLAGFEIGIVELDAQGRIQTMRVAPTHRPATPVQTRSGFAINEVALVNQNASIQMTAGAAAPMTLQLMALFKVARVELSEQFEVAQLVLEPAGSRVRVALDAQSRTTGGTEFETVQVRLDASRRIAEFVLNPAHQRLP